MALVLVIAAGTAWTLWGQRSPTPAHPLSALQAAAGALRKDPSGTARAQLDALYTQSCDPATGAPDFGTHDVGLHRAIDALQDASRNNLKDAGLHRLLGEYLLAIGSSAEAATELRTAATLGEDTGKLAEPLSYALLGDNRLEELLALPIPATATPHQIAVLRIIQARAMEGMGQFDNAAATLRLALKSEPDNLDATVRLGLFYVWHGDKAVAVQWLDQATRIAPEAPATLRLRGDYAYVTHDFAASAAAYRKVPATGPTVSNEPPSLGLARAQIYQGDLPGATATLDHTALPNNDPLFGYYRALLAFRSGDFHRAGELAELLVDRLHDDPDLNLLLGAATAANGYPETAHHYLELYVTAVPSNHAAQSLLTAVTLWLALPAAEHLVDPGRLYAPFGFADSKQVTRQGAVRQ